MCQVEAYECKMRINKLMRDDCTDLIYLANATNQRGYHANVGVISFDTDRLISRKLERLEASPLIKVYGLESIWKLQDSPF